MTLLLSGFTLLAAGGWMLAGLLPLEPTVSERWSMGGRWIYPVGAPLDHTRSGPEGEPGYHATRNVQPPDTDLHHGVDLSNRRRNGPVRAAAHGLAVVAANLGNGYGHHVVLAHRLPSSEIVYSVYAHLEPRSIAVAAGHAVRLGQPIGRVGRSGVASSPHLHFEVRRPVDPGERWENTEALDPVAFVAARLPSRDSDTTWARPYLAWAEAAGLIAPTDPGHEPVSRARWRRALDAALCRSDPFVVGAPHGGGRLEAAGLIDDREPLDPLDTVGWKEVGRNLERAATARLCLPPPPAPESERRADCRRFFDQERPTRQPVWLAKKKGHPTLAQLVLLLSDLAGE